MKVFLLASGKGTNFEKIYSRQEQLKRSGNKNYGEIECVFSNDPDAEVLKKAERLKIKTLSISSRDFFKALGNHPSDEEGRVAYDSEVISLIEKLFEPDLIVLAGYRRRLSRLFTERFKNKIINLYPGDTTKNYLRRGEKACVQAVENGEKTIKCTVYLQNDPEKRFGISIAQSVDITIEGLGVCDLEEMDKRIREQGEWKLFPFVVHDLIANGRVAIDGEDNIYVDGEKMDKAGFSL